MDHKAKNFKRKTGFAPWVMRTAALLICLTLFSVTFLSDVTARFASTASGSDSARVAKFAMETVATGQPEQIELKAGDTGSSGTYTFTVKNTSEVLVKYSVIVKQVPANVGVELNGTALTLSENSDDLVSTAKELAIDSIDTCNLTFCALEGAQTQSVNVTIQVYVEQVD